MNLVITLSRRFGTGASMIAKELSEKLDMPVYDKAYIEHELAGKSYADEAAVIKPSEAAGFIRLSEDDNN